MGRYFLALPLPGDVRRQLIALQPEPNEALRLLPVDELHLTLHFLGELTDVELRSACCKLTEDRFFQFSLQLRGVGQFPDTGPARVLWAGVELSAELQSLHRRLSEILRTAYEFVPDDRPYRPHVTLARVNGAICEESAASFLEQNRCFEISQIEVRQFVLYRSELIDQMPHYHQVVVFDLLPTKE